MPRVIRKLQVTAPRAQVSGDIPARLERFDRATTRQRRRGRRAGRTRACQRGWTREELYERGRSMNFLL